MSNIVVGKSVVTPNHKESKTAGKIFDLEQHRKGKNINFENIAKALFEDNLMEEAELEDPFIDQPIIISDELEIEDLSRENSDVKLGKAVIYEPSPS